MNFCIKILILLTLCNVFFSCNIQNAPIGSQRSFDTSKRKMSTVENNDTNQMLDDYLKRIAGVNVTGSGSNAVVRVRGITSVTSGNDPLFIVDGVPIASYNAAYSAINPMDIKNVRVLKNPSDTSIYGVRGANGVIIITRKSAN